MEPEFSTHHGIILFIIDRMLIVTSNCYETFIYQYSERHTTLP